jgi:hypothetical protein
MSTKTKLGAFSWYVLLPFAVLCFFLYWWVLEFDGRYESMLLVLGFPALVTGLYSLYLERRLGREITTYDEAFMLRCFEENVADFKRLGTLLSEDTWLTRFNIGRVEPAQPVLDRARSREYHRLLESVRTRYGFARYPETGDIAFCFASGFGIPGGGASFGYAFSKSGVVDPIVESFDAKALARRGVVFRRIREGWYTFYRVD